MLSHSLQQNTKKNNPGCVVTSQGHSQTDDCIRVEVLVDLGSELDNCTEQLHTEDVVGQVHILAHKDLSKEHRFSFLVLNFLFKMTQIIQRRRQEI